MLSSYYKASSPGHGMCVCACISSVAVSNHNLLVDVHNVINMIALLWMYYQASILSEMQSTLSYNSVCVCDHHCHSVHMIEYTCPNSEYSG